MKNILLFCFAIVALSCSSQNKNNSSVQNPADTSRWVYTTDTDRMTSGKRYFADINANEKINLEPPYDGGSTSILSLQNKNGVNTVIFYIDKGQLADGGQLAFHLRLRFDEDTAKYWLFTIPADGRSNFVSVSYKSANKIIEKLKATKKLKIEADFFGSGYKIVEFNVSGLKWNHSGKEDQKK